MHPTDRDSKQKRLSSQLQTPATTNRSNLPSIQNGPIARLSHLLSYRTPSLSIAAVIPNNPSLLPSSAFLHPCRFYLRRRFLPPLCLHRFLRLLPHTTLSPSVMTILRSIGNRFRRLEDRSENDSHSHHDASFNLSVLSHSLLPQTVSNKLLGSQDAPVDESPDLYYEDRPLGNSIHALEEIRLALRELATSANEHKDMLVAHASTERTLGDTLLDVMQPRLPENNQNEDQISLTENNPLPEDNASSHFSSYLPIEAREAQKALGKALSTHSSATIKLSVAISTPINELTRSFEERYNRKIVPLRKRYIDQKGQYLKYKRNADMADTDEKRSYYEALAEAAKPVWLRTSTELRTESDVMTELTAKNMAKWSRSLALQHERALAIAAANFADAFTRAKSVPSLSRTQLK